jgi:hypothetical protein
VRVHFNPEIAARECGFQNCGRGRPSTSAALIQVIVGNTLVVAAVEIIDRGDAHLHRRFMKRIVFRTSSRIG